MKKLICIKFHKSRKLVCAKYSGKFLFGIDIQSWRSLNCNVKMYMPRFSMALYLYILLLKCLRSFGLINAVINIKDFY